MSAQATYDVIVVGARCAGAATARLLAGAGMNVLLLDRARMPSDTMSTLYIHQPGMALLNDWGLLEALRASGVPEIRSVTYDAAELELAGSSRPVRGVAAAMAPRRVDLDKLLIDAAIEGGAEFQDQVNVSGLLWAGQRVAGVEVTSPTGVRHRHRAKFVIGADGMDSTVARLVGAGYTIQHPRLTCAYYTFWDRVSDRFELFERERRWIGVIPSSDHATLVGVYFPQDEFASVRRDVEGSYLRAIKEAAPPLFDRLMSSWRIERFVGTGRQLNFFRSCAGHGWALVGDAAHHKDSITARGITHAFMGAALLAERLITSASADISPLFADGYEQDLTNTFLEDYHGTLFAGSLTLDRQRAAALRIIARSKELIEIYFSVFSGAASQEELYTEEFLDELEEELGHGG